MAFVRYTLLRILLFLLVAALLWIIGLRGLVLVLVAILVSGAVSLFVLTGSRDAASVALAEGVTAVRRRTAAKAAAEDAWDEDRRSSSSDTPSAAPKPEQQ